MTTVKQMWEEFAETLTNANEGDLAYAKAGFYSGILAFENALLKLRLMGGDENQWLDGIDEEQEEWTKRLREGAE